MSSIKIKTIGLVNATDIEVKAVIKMLDNPGQYKPMNWVKIGKWRGPLGDITGVIDDPDPVQQNVIADKQEKEYVEFRKKFQRRTSEEKGKDTKLFTMYYCAVKDQYGPEIRPGEELLAKVREIQTKFFEKNPYRCFCDTALLERLIPCVESKKISVWSKLIFVHILEDQISTDMRYANQKK